MRSDLQLIADLVQPQTRVLDLGCGNGELLNYLKTNKSVTGYGLDLDAANIEQCLQKGVNVIEAEAVLDRLSKYIDDYVDVSKPP